MSHEQYIIGLGEMAAESLHFADSKNPRLQLESQIWVCQIAMC